MKNFISLLLVLSAISLSCNGIKNTTARKEDAKTQAALAESLQQKQAAGIDLYAKGSTPSSWTMEMDFNRIILFRSLDGTDYKSTPVPAVENTTNGTSVYTTKANKGDMVITVFREGCTDAMSGEKFNKKITVEVDGKRYEGCGQYLANAGLSGKWILETITSKTLQAADFAKGLPELVFDIEGGNLSGHDGCNSIKGKVEVRGDRIKFSAISGTKMACPGNKSEYEFIQKISNQTASYHFRNGQLVLYLIDDSTISFRKA